MLAIFYSANNDSFTITTSAILFLRCHINALQELSKWNPPVSGGHPSQRASNAESLDIAWRYYGPCTIPPTQWSHMQCVCANSLLIPWTSFIYMMQYMCTSGLPFFAFLILITLANIDMESLFPQFENDCVDYSLTLMISTYGWRKFGDVTRLTWCLRWQAIC